MVFWENGFGIYERTTASCAALLSSWPVQYGSNCDGIYYVQMHFENSHADVCPQSYSLDDLL